MPLTRPAGISQRWRHALAGLAGWLPSQCALCHAWPHGPLCHACLACHAPPVHRCAGCALALPAGAPLCGQCLRTPPPWDACLTAVDYGFPWSALLARFKFQAEPGLAATLAQLMRSAPGASAAVAQADWVLPMPLSPARLRQRGYNQALLLARALAPERAHARLLLRTHHAEAQSHLTRAQRLTNLRGAFMLDAGQAAQLQGRTVLLIDDVMTTGATLHAAAQPLRAAGVARLTTLVLARTPAPG